MGDGTTSLKCSSCGALLNVTGVGKSIVYCEYCGAANKLAPLTTNKAILSKQDIGSGYELTASKATLHKNVLRNLVKSPYAPLDILAKAEIIKEEHICLPVFLFNVNGQGTFGYDNGVQRERQRVEKRGDSLYTITETYTEWTPMTSTVSCSEPMFAPGSKDYSDLFDQFSTKLDVNKLIDIEELNYPDDIQALEFNYPMSASFNEYIKPKVEKLLKSKAEASLEGRNWRNGQMQGSNIMKDESTRVYVPFYHIVYLYNNIAHDLYMLHDGSFTIYDNVVEDPARKEKIDAQEATLNAVKSKSKALWILLIIAAAILGIVLWSVISGVGGFIVFLLCVAGGLVPSIIKIKGINKDYQARRDVEQQKLDAIHAELTEVVTKFINDKQPLQGIYPEVAGDSEAFNIN